MMATERPRLFDRLKKGLEEGIAHERGTQNLRVTKDVIEFLDSITPVMRSPEEWAEVEREFQWERDSWDFLLRP